MKFAIRNDFHNTTATVRSDYLSPRTVARVRRKLCGISGCTCGGNLSERGPQCVEIRLHQDGSATLHSILDEVRS